MTSSPAPPETPASTTRPPRSTPDLVATTGLLLLAAVLAMVSTVAVAVAGLVMGVSSCTEQTCALLGVFGGAAVATVGPWLGVLGLGAWAVVRSVRRRAWWSALAAALSVPVLWFGGGALMWLAAGGASA